MLCYRRDYWIQIDIQNAAQGFPAGCVAPSHMSHASLTHQNALLQQQHQHVLVPVLVCLTLTNCVLPGEQEDSRLSKAAPSQGYRDRKLRVSEPGNSSVSCILSVSDFDSRTGLTCE